MDRQERPSQGGKGYGSYGGLEDPHKDKECHHCGKKGHLKRDCWWRDTPKSEIPKRGPGKGAKADGKGKGRRTGGEAEETSQDAPEPEMEGAGMESLGQFSSECMEVTSDGWICCNVDSGASKTRFPEEADYGWTSPQKTPLKLRTASKAVVETKNRYTVLAKDEGGEPVMLMGHSAPIHKPLIAAGALTDKGSDVWMTGNGANSKGIAGYIIRKDSDVQKEVRRAMTKILDKYKPSKVEAPDGVIRLYKENGIYNFYVKGLKDLGPEPKTLKEAKESALRDRKSGTKVRKNTEEPIGGIQQRPEIPRPVLAGVEPESRPAVAGADQKPNGKYNLQQGGASSSGGHRQGKRL